MYDMRGKRLYDLYYCTREPIGLDRMKAAMWKIAPSGDFTFRDRFAGQAVDITVLIDHVIVTTPYYSSHVKKRTLVPLQKAGVITSPNQKRANQYPPGTIIQFPVAS